MTIRAIILFLVSTVVHSCAFNTLDYAERSQSDDVKIVVQLSLEPRYGAYDRPHEDNCNVKMYIFNNTKWPLWIYPKYSFYAENLTSRKVSLLRVVEEHEGGITAPYQGSGISVSLPAPPTPGIYKIYAVLEHSEIVFENYLKTHGNKIPMSIKGRIVSEEYGQAMWRGNRITNAITVEFI
jgi:hypothetical protein